MKAGKVRIPYKQVSECQRKPVPTGCHPVEADLQHQHQHDHHAHLVQYEVASSTKGSSSHRMITLVAAVLTIIIAGISISAQALLFKEYNNLRVEVDSQMQKLELMMQKKGLSSGSAESLQNLVNVDAIREDTLPAEQPEQSLLVGREKRSDEPPRSVSRNRNRDERRGDRTQSSEISVIHLVINRNHEQAPSGALKTGPRGAIVKYWKYSDDQFNDQQNFARLDTNTGEITIEKKGLYYIYSQMTYFDRSGRWSHQVSIDGISFIKCLASEWGIEEDPDTGVLYNTIHQCHTAAVTYIRRGQKVTIQSMYPERVIHADKDMTFVGLVKLT